MSAALKLTSFMMSNEISVLRRLHGMLETGTIQSRDQFNDMMRAAFSYGDLNHKQLSDDLGYSASTVYRWIEGKSAPHPSLWPRIIDWVMSAIDLKIDEHTNQAQKDLEEA